MYICIFVYNAHLLVFLGNLALKKAVPIHCFFRHFDPENFFNWCTIGIMLLNRAFGQISQKGSMSKVDLFISYLLYLYVCVYVQQCCVCTALVEFF